MSEQIRQAVKKFEERLDAGWEYSVARQQTAKDFGISGQDIEDNYLEADWAAE